MAITWADNFQSYGTNINYMLDGAYAQVSSTCTLVDDPDPNVTANVLFVKDGFFADGLIRKVLPASVTTSGMCARFWFPGLPTSVSSLPALFEWRNTLNEIQASLRIETDGHLSFYRGDHITGTNLGTTTAPCIVSDAWQHVEVKGVFSDTVGTLEVRVEGVSVLSLTGLDNLATTGPITQVAIRSRNPASDSGGKDFYVKDFVIWDSTGSFNNTFLGTVHVLRLPVNGLNTAGDWHASSGSNFWDLMEESPPDDTDYTSANVTDTTAAKYDFQDLPVEVNAVKALIPLIRVMKSDGGDGNLQNGIKSTTNTVLGADRPVTVAQTYWWDVMETDPDTAALWSPTVVNAAKLQLDRTA